MALCRRPALKKRWVQLRRASMCTQVAEGSERRRFLNTSNKTSLRIFRLCVYMAWPKCPIPHQEMYDAPEYRAPSMPLQLQKANV